MVHGAELDFASQLSKRWSASHLQLRPEVSTAHKGVHPDSIATTSPPSCLRELLLDPREIYEVLGPACGTLVRGEVGEAQHRNRRRSQLCDDAALPGFLPRHTIDPREDIDANRCNADLNTVCSSVRSSMDNPNKGACAATANAPTTDNERPLLHICCAPDDRGWVQGYLVPALGLTNDQYHTREDDGLGEMQFASCARFQRFVL